jgi:hypothetical protein
MWPGHRTPSYLPTLSVAPATLIPTACTLHATVSSNITVPPVRNNPARLLVSLITSTLTANLRAVPVIGCRAAPKHVYPDRIAH